MPFPLNLQSQAAQKSYLDHPSDTDDLAVVKLQEELGELAQAYWRRQRGIKGTTEEQNVKMRDAVGDLVLALMIFCDRQGWSFEDCVMNAWEEIKSRDYARFPNNGKSS